jgi:hypothetical protein
MKFLKDVHDYYFFLNETKFQGTQKVPEIVDCIKFVKNNQLFDPDLEINLEHFVKKRSEDPKSWIMPEYEIIICNKHKFKPKFDYK